MSPPVGKNAVDPITGQTRVPQDFYPLVQPALATDPADQTVYVLTSDRDRNAGAGTPGVYSNVQRHTIWVARRWGGVTRIHTELSGDGGATFGAQKTWLRANNEVGNLLNNPAEFMRENAATLSPPTVRSNPTFGGMFVHLDFPSSATHTSSRDCPSPQLYYNVAISGGTLLIEAVRIPFDFDPTGLQEGGPTVQDKGGNESCAALWWRFRQYALSEINWHGLVGVIHQVQWLYSPVPFPRPGFTPGDNFMAATVALTNDFGTALELYDPTTKTRVALTSIWAPATNQVVQAFVSQVNLSGDTVLITGSPFGNEFAAAFMNVPNWQGTGQPFCIGYYAKLNRTCGGMQRAMALNLGKFVGGATNGEFGVNLEYMAIQLNDFFRVQGWVGIEYWIVMGFSDLEVIAKIDLLYASGAGTLPVTFPASIPASVLADAPHP